MNLSTVFAYDPNDTDEARLQKITIFLVAGSCTIAGCIWTLMYYLVFGFGLTTLLPLLFVIIVSASLLISHFTRNISYAIYAQIICIIYITTFIQWSIGGVFDSGFVLAWAFCGPIGALIFFPFRKSVIWFLLYLLNLAITVGFDDFFVSHGQVVEEGMRRLFFIMNLSFSSLVVFIFAGYFVSRATTERQRADGLLLNTLPKEIVSILKSGRKTIADHLKRPAYCFATSSDRHPFLPTWHQQMSSTGSTRFSQCSINWSINTVWKRYEPLVIIIWLPPGSRFPGTITQ